ncbi:winged helix-turn-helix domain-containing protein [Stakelama saccharophila]|uniref:LysR family transcriptional regulator n=1 Tax=Stakelama saccharophila TaxID=3075605 RepID=A0ABZ0BD26_9SPHN|nr:LysR family transcriptional regulator [Stakelama sp. W311]WNO54773.1 LysR family transcriptional regulator [Stakelama sp. W311]
MRIGPLKVKAQLYCGEEIAMGPGKADLLDAIRAAGSISRAARAMGMSYRRTWMLVDGMNRCWAERVVETTAGGGKRSGARLTAFGERLLALYRALEADLARAGESDAFAALAAHLRKTPQAPDAR